MATQAELLQKLQALSKYAWYCPDPKCPGDPHDVYLNRHARPNQRPPQSDWWGWFLRSGRGFGKTRSGSEFVKDRMLTIPGHRVAIIVPDFGVGRDVCIEGRSGLHGPTAGEGVIPKNRIKLWNRSLGELVLDNGSIAKIFGCDKRKDAEKLRGFEFSTAWFEELGSCAYGEVAWDMLEFGLRADDPKVVITSTPRPTPLIKRLCADPDILVVTGSTYDNIDNLAPKFAARIKRRYEGTTLGRQELYGEILDGSDGALWSYDIIQRVAEAPHLVTVVVAVDPAGTAHATSDLTGILVMGLGEDGKIYVLADKSDRYSPEQWRKVVVQAYEDYNADAVVAEVNFGADMVAANLRTSDIGVRPVFVPVRASRGKAIRATPVVGLYEQGRGRHVGTFPELEVELTTWVPPGQFDADGEPIPESKWSPNRLDALCLVGDTPVLTAVGGVEISRVRVGDRVWTRNGWRRVAAAGISRRSAPILEVAISDGSSLRGTGNHPVWVVGRGWVRIDALVCGDTLDAWTTTKRRSGMGLKRGEGGTRRSPSNSGLTPRRMPEYARRLDAALCLWRTTRTLFTVLGRVPGGRRTKSIATRSRYRVPFVTSPFGRVSTDPSRPTAPVRVVGLRDAGVADVYDLAVAETHEFVASGVVVHNCWGATHLALKPRRPRSRMRFPILG